MNRPTISIVIPVHTETRPVERAVRSAIGQDTTKAQAIEVIVVCHEVSNQAIKKRLGELTSNQTIRVLEFKDGVRSPAGPINFGLRQAKGKWILIVGSDDYLEDDFAAQYLNLLQARPELDVVLLPIRLSNNFEYFPSPIPQLGIRRNLRTIRDRLFYRTAPAALVKTSLLQDADAELYTEGIPTGEDIIHSAWLWTHAKKIYMDRKMSHYVATDDANDRVTTMSYTSKELQKPFEILVQRTWFQQLPHSTRNAFGIKYFRSNVLPRFTEDLDFDTRVELSKESQLLEKWCNIDCPTLSLSEKRLLVSIREQRHTPLVNESQIHRKIIENIPVNFCEVFSPNSRASISIDIVLGNLLWSWVSKKARHTL
jgi:hypothetical protein